MGKTAAFLCGVILVVALLSGCTTPQSLEDRTEVGVTPKLSGARGPLTAARSRAILDKLRAEAPDADVLKKHLAFEEAVSETPLSTGNKVILLRDGPATFAAIAALIRDAKNHINLEYFIIEDVDLEGTKLSDLLIQKRQQGVRVNLIYDSFGSSSTPDEMFARLRDAGVNMVAFNPVSASLSGSSYSINDRDHRKMLIVDGTRAVTGGINLSEVYSSNPLRRPKGADAPTAWRDTDIAIEGPAVAEMQRLFIQTWTSQKGAVIDQEGFFPPPVAADGQVVRVIGSAPAQDRPIYYITLLSAIRSAETRIFLTTGYFVPPREALEDLIAAARRGVDVQLLLPSQSDWGLALHAGRSYYARLLEAGVKIYELRDATLHSKTVVIDGVWSAIGSSNFDTRSAMFNDEIDLVILGRETGEAMEALFQEDVANADRIDPKVWRGRSISQRAHEFFSRLWAYWL